MIWVYPYFRKHPTMVSFVLFFQILEKYICDSYLIEIHGKLRFLEILDVCSDISWIFVCQEFGESSSKKKTSNQPTNQPTIQPTNQPTNHKTKPPRHWRIALLPRDRGSIATRLPWYLAAAVSPQRGTGSEEPHKSGRNKMQEKQQKPQTNIQTSTVRVIRVIRNVGCVPRKVKFCFNQVG